jgi:hypothetical protein
LGTAFQFSFPFAGIIAVFFSIFYNTESLFFIMVNELLNGRIALAKAAIVKYGINMWGRYIVWVGKSNTIGYSKNTMADYNYVDNSYVQILLNYGLIFLIIICLIFTLCTWSAVKTENKSLSVVLFMIALQCITYPQLLYLVYNPFVLLIGVFINSTEWSCTG